MVFELQLLETLDFNKSVFSPLQTEEETVIHKVLSLPSDESLRTSFDRFIIPVKELKSLFSNDWITDTVIDSYLALLVSQSDQFFQNSTLSEENVGDILFRPHMYAFSSFFYTRLLSGDDKYDFSGVRQWTKNFDVLERDLLLFPIMWSRVHWFLMGLDLRTKRVLYIDPLSHTVPIEDIGKNLLFWLRDEVQDKHGKSQSSSVNISEWKCINCLDIPIQIDANSCGIYLLLFAHYLEQGKIVDFVQEDIFFARKRISWFLAIGRVVSMTEVVRKSRENNKGETEEERFFHSRSPELPGRVGGLASRRPKTETNLSKVDATKTHEGIRKDEYMTDYDCREGEVEVGFPSSVLDSVFKLYVTHCEPNYSLPWQKRRQTYSTSSAFAVEDQRILTNAHCVEHSTVVKIKKRGSEKKYMAQIVSIGNDCDIALLTVEDASFWEGVNCLLPGRLPYLQEAVTVVGYPIGGENISVTAGVVSRVELQQYSHGAIDLLGVQIDAAINSGNSGGPAFNNRFECVGIAFQSLLTTEAENIGYIIPWLVVQHFLDDVERNGHYTGFCYCGFEFQRMENQYLRDSFRLKDDDGGVLVKKVAPTSLCSSVLRKGDVVTHFDDILIASDGTVAYRGGERINFHYLVTLKFVGEYCKLRFIRDGTPMETSYPLEELPLLVPVHERRLVPEYLTIAGLVFVALSEPYLRSEYGEKWDYEAPVKLLDKLLYGYKSSSKQQVVILSQVLHARINVGYEYLTNTELIYFNGTRVENLAHLARLIDDTEEEFLRFDLEFDEVIVVQKKASIEESSQILVQHGIPTPRSLSYHCS
eukprot:jgi/Galph1/2931/GphlegSOOS_G1600.1